MSSTSPARFFVAAVLVARAAVGFRTGFARRPVVAGSTGLVAAGLRLVPAEGARFSLSGSAKVTVFLTGLDACALVDVVVPAGRPRVGFLTGAAGVRSSSTSSSTACVFFARVRVALDGSSSFTASLAGFLAGLPRVARAGAGAGAGAGSGSTIFLGRPGPRVALTAVLEAGCCRLAAVSTSLSSSSSSSARVLRLTDVLVDGAARVEALGAGAAAARVVLVFDAAATGLDLAADDAVPEVALLLGAALDRVTRLGGDAGGSMLP